MQFYFQDGKTALDLVKSNKYLTDLLQFYDYIRDGKEDRVIKLLEDQSNLGLLDGFDRQGDSPLHIACRNGRLELVKHFIAIKGEDYLLTRNQITNRNILDHACAHAAEGGIFQNRAKIYDVIDYLTT